MQVCDVSRSQDVFLPDQMASLAFFVASGTLSFAAGTDLDFGAFPAWVGAAGSRPSHRAHCRRGELRST